MLSVPFGAFYLILGLLWGGKKPAPPPDDAEPDALRDYQQARRRLALVGLARIGLVLLGIAVLLGNVITGLGTVRDGGSFAALLAAYSLLILFVQRSEANRRLATLLIMSILWLVLLPRYAAYREIISESNWAILAALGLNYAFWLLIGRRYPVGSSEDIQVWGMD